MRITELVATFRDLPLGTTDASVIATAERLGVRDIGRSPTLHRRAFTVVRSRLGGFPLLPCTRQQLAAVI
jgi:hypothetical protein